MIKTNILIMDDLLLNFTFFEKIYSNRLQVHRFRGSELTENPPAIPARSTAGGRRAGLNL